MHDYSIDRHPKEKILFVLAFLAIWAAPHLNSIMRWAVEQLELSMGWNSPMLTAVPVFALFLLLHLLFEKVLWKLKWLRRLLLVPDLNGKWKCQGLTTLRGGVASAHPWDAQMTITQSWSKLLVHIRTPRSESKSVSASLFHEPGVGYRLFYQYSNDPRAGEPDLHRHYGVTELLFVETESKGSGHYFTDQHRQTVGTIQLVKEQEDGTKT